MEINRTSGPQPQRVPDIAPATGRPAAGSDTPGEHRDRIELTDAGREVVQQPSAMARRALLKALRERLDAGTYRVDAEGIARRIASQEDI